MLPVTLGPVPLIEGSFLAPAEVKLLLFVSGHLRCWLGRSKMEAIYTVQ